PLGNGSMPVAEGSLIPTGGLHTDADPTGRGPAIHEPGGESSSGPASHGGGMPSGNNASSGGGSRSAGATPAHQDARDDPTSHDRGQHNQGSGSDQGDGGHQGGGDGQSGG